MHIAYFMKLFVVTMLGAMLGVLLGAAFRYRNRL